MTASREISDALDAVGDAFDHLGGESEFEPSIDNSSEAGEGKVALQKACRLIEAAEMALDGSDYYTSAVEQSFASIERTLEGYLINVAGDDPRTLMDHEEVYERAKAQAPLDDDTVKRIASFYDQRRTSTYYGTTVATRQQAETMVTLARAVHDHLTGFETEMKQFCTCGE